MEIEEYIASLILHRIFPIPTTFVPSINAIQATTSTRIEEDGVSERSDSLYSYPDADIETFINEKSMNNDDSFVNPSFCSTGSELIYENMELTSVLEESIQDEQVTEPTNFEPRPRHRLERKILSKLESFKCCEEHVNKVDPSAVLEEEEALEDHGDQSGFLKCNEDSVVPNMENVIPTNHGDAFGREVVVPNHDSSTGVIDEDVTLFHDSRTLKGQKSIFYPAPSVYAQEKPKVSYDMDEIVANADQVQNSGAKRKEMSENEESSASVYHGICQVSIPKFLNGPPRLGLSKTFKSKMPLHKRPKF